MPDKAFWHIIKQKLESLNLPPEESDWECMSQSLDHPIDQKVRTMLNQHEEPLQNNEWDLFLRFSQQHSPEESELSPLDRKLKDKLEDFTLPLEEDAWRLFQDSLIENRQKEAPLPQVSIRKMEVPLMDATIRRKLEGLTLAPLYADWYDMLELLESDFDRQVHHSLSKFEASGQPSEWKRMSLLLDQISRPVRTFPWMRATAAALVFFVLLIGGNFWMIKNNISYSFTSWIKKNTSPTRLAPDPGSALANREDIPTSEKSTSTKQKQDEKNADTLEMALFDQATLAENKPPNPRIGTWDASRTLPIDLIKDKSLDSDSYQAPNSKAGQESLSDFGSNEILSQDMNQLRNNYQVNKMGIMAVNELWEMHEKEKPWLPSLGRKKLSLWLGVYGATAQTKAELNGPKADKPGYTTGIRAMLQLNERWSFVTGVAYGKKEFQYAYRFLADSLAMKGSLTVVDIPLLMRYELKTENELKLYLQAGAVTTLSLNESYLDFNPNTPQNGGINSLSPFGNEPSSYAQKLNSYPGNVLLSFGVAYPFAERYRIELEPYFLQNLQRVGGVERNSIKKRLYTAGIGVNFFFNANSK